MSVTLQALVWIAVAALYAILTAVSGKRIYAASLPGTAVSLLLSLLGVTVFVQCTVFIAASTLSALLFEYT